MSDASSNSSKQPVSEWWRHVSLVAECFFRKIHLSELRLTRTQAVVYRQELRDALATVDAMPYPPEADALRGYLLAAMRDLLNAVSELVDGSPARSDAYFQSARTEHSLFQRALRNHIDSHRSAS